MDFLRLAKERYSVRSYTNQRVEPEKLQQILEAARVAPTAANLQPVRLVVVQEQAGLDKLKKAANVYGAPVAILVCVDHEKAWKRSFDGVQTTHIDASILTDHMMLEATDLGLGSLWVCHFDPKVLRQEFALPDNLEPVNILAVGYGNQTAQSPDRHDKLRIPMEQLVFAKE